MKKSNIIITLKTVFLASAILFMSCEDDDIESDAGKVIPNITSLEGATVAYQGDVLTYNVYPPRGGSEYTWTVTGGTIQMLEGRTDKINVLYETIGTGSISVFETAANGLTSDTVEIPEITIFGTPCEWTVNMNDSYGDGWNGASLSFSVSGIVIGEASIDSDTGTAIIQVPNEGDLEITFNSGDYDEEVTFEIFDASGTSILADGPTPATGVVYSGVNICP